MTTKPKSPPTKKPVRANLGAILEDAAKALEAIPVNPSSPYWHYRQKQVDKIRAALSLESVERMVEQGAKALHEHDRKANIAKQKDDNRTLRKDSYFYGRVVFYPWGHGSLRVSFGGTTTEAKYLARSRALLRSLGIHPLK